MTDLGAFFLAVGFMWGVSNLGSSIQSGIEYYTDTLMGVDKDGEDD